MIGPTPPIYRSILVSLRLPSAAANRFGFIADFAAPYSSAKLFMSLLSKARDFLRGLISFTGVKARKENLITALSAPWHSSGYALYSPAGRPTSLTMNPSISTPSQNEIPPLPRLDGAPQTLEHRREALGVGRLSRRRFSCAGGRPWVGTKSGEIRLNWAS